ncbi:hypothetical protein BM92_19600 (plasmid) [Haloferax mediterranei ATCC 33500]|uniref:Uncharacterized protein n=1 Tax=Haloferax mediterranei (strain ATCC 33500 / DSM 1411 / JCM 8866 / NBRC 14739 / NCIMB 2177 / R-4) TaxID=523841 RepID=A0A059TUL0_HALMT|nr:hypothetical protein BM92_19600 [Haloferax mediterranei ATCC 33500]
MILSSGDVVEGKVFKKVNVTGEEQKVDITFAGDIQGWVGSIGMGVNTQLECYVKDIVSGDTDSTLVMDKSSNWVNLDSVYDQYGPNSGTGPDGQSYLDYTLRTELGDGIYEIGLKHSLSTAGYGIGQSSISFLPNDDRINEKTFCDYAYIRLDW